MEKQGVFYAVSVGPGDPELLTRQACRVLADCPVVAAPRMKSGRMLALDIAAGAVDMQGKTILPLDFTMERSEAVREDSYRMAAAAIEAELSAGRDVAMVNLGDVSVYATAYYILERIRADGFETVMCPGVTSFCAVAARLGRSLTRMEEPLHILPGSAFLAEKPSGKQWRCAYATDTLYAGFPHFHFYAKPVMAQRFLAACRKETL